MSKIVDTQLLLLSVAAERQNGAIVPPNYLQGHAAAKILRPLLRNRFIEELPAAPGEPVYRWNRKGRPVCLRITERGRALIGVVPPVPITEGDQQNADRSRCSVTPRQV